MNRIKCYVSSSLLVAFLLSIAAPELSFSAEEVGKQVGEQVRWQAYATGGTRASGTGYICSSTFGQVAVGLLTSGSYNVNQGFWQNMVASNCCLNRTGNVDCDLGDGVDISDLTVLIDYLFISFTPLCCTEEANVDGQLGVDISDLTALIDHLFISFNQTAVCQ